MAKQLNVNLAFTAETGQAKASIMELQKSLTQISAGVNLDKTISPEKLQAASAAAKSLSMHLNNAFNAQTGNFDLSKLNASLSRSKQSVAGLSSQLLSAGKSGQQAFVQLAQSISMADRPLVTLSSKMSGLLTTLKNTAKWQISSSILHGFIGAVSTAYNYAQDLNESLNNIRIVTGYNTDAMEQFAIAANKAAKELNTTTNEYAKASLIYFQQGLSMEEVEKRTAVTTKMANVSRQSAEAVSDQLTAIWNNFAKGADNLEYYADVVTALGAATASSSEEIATGLEKFAAVAETVGLSYEYATAALATVTATTRQSADVVGTAFKTLFARLNDLKLGETLDDGTTLGQYTENLAKVGVNIKDVNGQLKGMDQILTETAAKWDELDRGQQTALAKGVAGIRQYTQFIALMDNWDFMEKNLETVENSGGTLQGQAETYEESWEAASKQVQASLEAIYTAILDDDFFIDLSKGFSSILDGIKSFIDGVGGIKTVFMGIGSIFLSAVAGKIGPALQQLAHNFSVVFQSAQQQATTLANQMNKSIVEGLKTQEWSLSQKVALENAQALNTAKAKLQAIEKSLTAEEKQRAEGELAVIQNLQTEAETMAKIIEQKQQALDLAKEELNTSTQSLQQRSTDGRAFEITGKSREAGEQDLINQRDAALADYQANRTKANQEALNQAKQALNDYRTATDEASFASEKFTQKLAEAYIQEMKNTDGNISQSTAMVELNDILTPYAEKIDKIAQAYNNHHSSIVATQENMRALQGEIESVVGNSLPGLTKAFERVTTAGSGTELKQAMADLKKELAAAKIPAKDLEKILSKLGYKTEVNKIASGFQNVNSKASDLSKRLEELTAKQEAVNKAFNNFNPSHTVTGLERVMASAAGLGQVAMALTSFRSILTALNDEDMSWGERFTTIAMGISMMVPSAMGAIRSLNTAMGGNLAMAIAAMNANRAYNTTIDEQITKTSLVAVAKRIANGADQEAILTGIAESAVKKGLIKEEEKESYILALKAKLKGATILMSLKNAAVKLLETIGIRSKTAADAGETTGIWAKVAAKIAELAVSWPLLAVTLLIVAAIASLVAIVAIAVTTFQFLSDQYNADAIAAEQAAEAAKNLSEAYNECKQEYEDMISAMENYKTAREGLAELTKGAEEYRKALEDANHQALELIQQYGLIEGQDYEWQDSELVIKDEAMERVTAEKEKETDRSYAASQMANIEAKRAKAVADQTAMRRRIRDENGVGDGDMYWKAVLDNIFTSALTLGIAPAIGMANRNEKAANFDEAINKAIELGQKDDKIFSNKDYMAEALQLDDKDLIDALWENREAMQELSQEFNAAAEAEKVAAQNIANEIMSQSGYKNSEAGAMALEAGGEIYQQLYDKAFQTSKDTKMAGFWGGGTDEGKAMWAEYAKLSGVDELEGYKVIDYRKDGKVEYEYKDENGKKQTKLVTEEEIAAVVATAQAERELEKALSQLRNKISELNVSVDVADHAMAEFLSKGNLEGTTREEFDALKKDVTTNGKIDDEKVDSVLGLSGDATKDLALARSYGYESAEAYKEAFIKSLEVEWNVPAGISKDLAGQLTLGASEKIRSTFKTLGNEGGQAFIDTINSMVGQENWDILSLEEQTVLLEEMANIDWTSWDAGDQAVKIAKEYGVVIDEASDSWQKNVNAMRDAANALPDLEALRQEFEKILDITEDIKIGDILETEDYELLVKYNKELTKYFAILSDGSAQFIGDKLDFQQEIKETNRQNLEDAMKAYQDRYQEIEEQIQKGANAVGGIERLDSYRDSENYTKGNKNYYSGANVDTQLEFLETQGYDAEQLSKWRLDLQEGKTTTQILEDIAKAVDTTADAYGELGAEAEKMKELIQGSMNEIALSAEDADERLALLKEGTINSDAYEYAAMAAHNTEKWEDIDPDEVDDYAKSLKNAAGNSKLLSDSLEANQEAAEDVALYTKKMNKGIDALADGIENWSDILKNSSESSEEYAAAMGDIKHAMSDVLGVSEDFLSDDFIIDNMKDIELAAKGDADAIDRLAIAAANDILINVDFEDEEIKTKALALHDELAMMIPDIEVGAVLDDGDFLDKAAQVVETAGMTVEQANAYFRALGFEPHFETKEVTQTVKKPKVRTHTDYTAAVANVSIGGLDIPVPTFDAIQTSWNEGYTEVTESIEVPSLTTDDGKPNFKLTRTNAGGMNNYSGSNKGGKSPGGGGSKPKKTSEAKKDKTDIVDRYKEVNDQLAKTQRLMDKNSTLADTLWGPDKIKKIQENTKALKEENKQLDEKIKLQKQYLQEDKGELVKAASDVGLNFEFGEDDTILNYTTEMTKLHEQREAMLAGFGDEMDETEQETLEKFDEKLEAVTSAYETYEETLNEGFEFDQEKLENEIEQMENRFQEIELKLEVEIELNENDIADIEHQLERLGDNNVYASAERIALIQKNAVSYRNIADAQMEAIKEAERLYAAGEISKENYMARLQESKEALQDAEMSIREGIQQIGEELSNTFDLVDEKLDQQFNKFDQMIELMDHYKNVVSLTQGEASYKEFNEILKTSQEILRNRIAADESEVAMWTARKEQLEAEMKGMDKNSPEYLAAEEALNNIMKKEADAKSQLMADIEQLGEYAQEIFENAIEQAKIDFEEAMFGGRLSSVIESIEMLNAKQEEVLTTTNKIYETNKLIRNVEKDIEATTNNRAKQAYAEFQNKVKQKQEQNELTQFELDLLNAEYEITKAQIALEEAQNAKDTVRLTRDSEGNYGYVYTANEDKIADAEQALDDATNNYYNTALEGAQKYQDQIYQHIEEWEEKVTEVMKDQTLSEEEKNKKIAEITATYDEMIRRDKQLYYIAIDGIRDSSYNTQVDYDLKGIESAENWFDECDGFIEDLKTAQDEYDTNTQEIATHTENNFGKMSDAIDSTKKAGQKLVEDMTKSGGIIDTCNNELKNSIDNATLAWQKYIEALEEVIKLTDEAMKKNHDTQLTEAYKEDYAAEISKRLANGADYNDYDIQQLLQARWDKMGGVDNTDYQALINAGGTPEQIALWEVLRRFKIDKTDWSSSDASYADEIRATKMDQDFAQLIINYLKSSSHARWSDETVQGYLAARQAKIDEGHESAKGAISNEELKIYVAQLLNKKPEQLKTGGYTGSWGPEGRLAVLHEKELVLNAEDTKNFLTATQILREISDMLDHNALVASLGAINLRAMTVNEPADKLLQQEVTIHADFPNVTDHNEIEMAIDNLINAASQHAYKS